MVLNMFCTRCGTNNLDVDQFCRACSAPLKKTGEAQAPGASSGSPQQQYPYSNPYPSSGPGQQQQQQQQPQGYGSYPGYQGYQPQYNYGAQMSTQQSGASGRAIGAL